MCEHLQKTDMESAIVYKVVAKRGERYFSLAMGIEYHDGENVEIPKKQKKLSDNFNSGILTYRNQGYRPLMVGRTAGFTVLASAEVAMRGIKRLSIKRGYKIVLIRARVSVDLCVGIYGLSTVIAGKKIDIFEEC